MGTSMTCYYIINKGLSEDEIRAKLPLIPNCDVSSAAVIFSESAKWLPLYEESICENCNLSSRTASVLSGIFESPVLGLELVDSDILCVSYSDKSNAIAYDHAKANHIEMLEMVCMDESSAAFPEFLLAYCDEKDHKKIKEIWNATNYTFEDDRMRDICELIKAKVLYDFDNIPDGYKKVEII